MWAQEETRACLQAGVSSAPLEISPTSNAILSRLLPPGDLPVVVVGGGAPLCGDSLAGASTVLRPHHAAVANAVGAAICQVSDVTVPGWPMLVGAAIGLVSAERSSSFAAAQRVCWI